MTTKSLNSTCLGTRFANIHTSYYEPMMAANAVVTEVPMSCASYSAKRRIHSASVILVKMLTET